MKPILSFLIALLVSSSGFSCEIIYVKTDGVPFTSLCDHTSWTTATSELQSAIDAMNASGGGEVWVAAGTYYPTTTTDRTISFYPKNNVTVYGGFFGDETTLEERALADRDTSGTVEPWEFLNESILSGNIGDAGNEKDNSYHVVNGEGTDSTALFNGFTIQAGYMNYERDHNHKGAGIYFSNLNYCVIKDNHGDSYGGGAANSNLSFCLITDNKAEDGGGVCECTLKGCILVRNRGFVYGGSAYKSVLTDCKIRKNEAGYRGGGANRSTLYNCLIDSNYCRPGFWYEGASGVDDCILFNSIVSNNYYGCWAGISRSEATNCLIINNPGGTTDYGGPNSLTNCRLINNGLLSPESTYNNCLIANCETYNEVDPFFRTVLINCTIVNNGSKFSGGEKYNCILWNTGNEPNETGPRFVNPTDFIGRAETPEQLEMALNADWSLQPGSPYIDAGDNSLYEGPDYDLAGNARIINDTIDMGAYENPNVVQPDINGIVYIKENGTGNGNSWENAAGDINTALSFAETKNIQQIWVAKGTYYPTTTSDRTISFYPKNNVTVYGGFFGNETTIEERELADRDTSGTVEPWEFLNESILSGNIGDAGNNRDNSYHVVNGEGTDSTALINGFTILGGYNYNSEIGVGGYFCNLNYCVIKDNHARFYGGGAANSNLSFCLLADNLASEGGGAYECTLKGCVLVRNRGSMYGGGAYNSVLTDCKIRKNGAGYIGGGAIHSTLYNCLIDSNYCFYPPDGAAGVQYCTLFNCIVSNNQLGLGGICGSEATNCLIYNNLGHTRRPNILKNCRIINDGWLMDGSTYINCLFANNDFGEEHDAFWNCTLTNCTLVNNIGWYSAGEKMNCILWNTGDEPNETSPRFVNPTDFNGLAQTPEQLELALNADWSLQPGSPYIDAGDNSLYEGPDYDLAGNARIINDTIDMGAYENPNVVQPDINGIVYIKENGTGNGNSWENAAGDINTALAFTETKNIQQIWVAKGTYYPTTTSDRTISFYPKNNVTVYGGFFGNETTIEERELADRDTSGTVEPWEFLNESILSGNIGELETLEDNSYNVVNGESTDTTSCLNGFTIKGGNQRYGSDYNGTPMSAGANYCNLKNCIIKDNYARFYGGGAANSNLSFCLISDNKAGDGGGGYNCTLKGCVLVRNLGISWGGGACNSVLTDCIIRKNESLYRGGGAQNSELYNCLIDSNFLRPGVWHDGGGGVDHCILFNCTISNNSGDGVAGIGDCTATKCLIYNNWGTGTEDGAGDLINCRLINNDMGHLYDFRLINCLLANNYIREIDPLFSYLMNCTFVNNSNGEPVGSLINSIVWNTGETPNETGPRFVNPTDFIGRTNNPEKLQMALNADWSLQPGSPYIDAGDNSLYEGPDYDLEGRQRIINNVIDMGAYEAKEFVTPPALTINFPGERTNESVSPEVAYNSVNDFESGYSMGSGSPVSLFPNSMEQWMFYTQFETDTTISPVCSLGIPSRPAEPGVKIDYVTEILSGVTINAQWDISGSFEDIHEGQPISDNIPDYGEDQEEVEVIVAATETSFKSDAQYLEIPARPAMPATEIDFPSEVLTNVGENTQWNISGSFEDIQDGQLIADYIPGYGEDQEEVDVIVAATDTSFKSDTQYLEIPARPAMPATEIDFPSEVLTNVGENTQWNASGSFEEILDNQSLTDYIPGYGEDQEEVDVIVAATDTSFKSDTQYLEIPARPALPATEIDYPSEALTNVGENTQWNASGSFEEILNDQPITDYIPGFGEDQEEVDVIVAATDTSFRSDVQDLEIPARPAAPTQPVVNDTENTFSWDWSASGYNDAGDYEYITNDQTSWVVCEDNPIQVGNIDIPAGSLKLRVLASSETGGERFHSDDLPSDMPFTIATGADGIENGELIRIYPTITSDIIYCVLPTNEVYEMELFSMQGILIDHISLVADRTEIDLSGLQPGMYLIKVSKNSLNPQVFRVIKK